MEERSIIAYEHYRDATQRFEYFYSGIIAAICAYMAQSYKPGKLGLNPNLLEILSLVLLFLSLFYSIKRMEKFVQVLKYVYNEIRFKELKGKLVANRDIAPFVNEQTGRVYSLQDVDDELNLLNSLLPKLEDNIDKMNTKAEQYYVFRNWVFYFGLVLLIISKVLRAYV